MSGSEGDVPGFNKGFFTDMDKSLSGSENSGKNLPKNFGGLDDSSENEEKPKTSTKSQSPG
jgi:hypothetical protein